MCNRNGLEFILKRLGFKDVEAADCYAIRHGDVYFKERRRPMYVIRGAWNAQAPGTNERIIGYALEHLSNIPSVLLSEVHGCLFFGTPGQVKKLNAMRSDDVVTMWWYNKAKRYLPIYKSDITHAIAVPTKDENPYPKKWDLDRDNIIKEIDYV